MRNMAVYLNSWCLSTLVLIFAQHVCSISAVAHQEELDSNPGTQKVRVRRQFYVCPPDFKRISNNCYYFSQHMATWQNAHWDCQDRYSELAVLQTAAEDKKLRGQLNKLSKTPREWWIGGIYDWEQMKWKWGVTGKNLEYHGFSRMSPDSKEKLLWHCIILDPKMKYKWSARSCVLGKYYICQKKVERVNKRGLEKLRKRYNNTLNEIPAPIYEKPIKPRKHENWSNGHAQPNLKHHRPNGVNVHHKHQNSAFGHRKNITEIRRGRKRDRKNNRDGRRNRKLKPIELYVRNGTEVTRSSDPHGHALNREERRNRKRNRRNKSKENNNSIENVIPRDEPKKISNEISNNAIEDITQKTSFLTNTISPLHPRHIIEEHDFLD